MECFNLSYIGDKIRCISDKVKGRKSNVKILYCILSILFILIVMGEFIIYNKKEIRYIIKREEYPKVTFGIEDAVTYNDCVIDKEGNLRITGDDPYLLYTVNPLWAWNISIDCLGGFKGKYKVYYALNENFSEEKTKFEKGNEIIIGDFVNALRIDIEDTSKGKEYRILNNGNLILNGESRVNIRYLISTLFIYLLFAFLMYVYLVRTVWGEKFAIYLIGYLYLLAINHVWAEAVSKNIEISVRIIMLVSLCCGLLFVREIVRIENEKK